MKGWKISPRMAAPRRKFMPYLSSELRLSEFSESIRLQANDQSPGGRTSPGSSIVSTVLLAFHGLGNFLSAAEKSLGKNPLSRLDIGRCTGSCRIGQENQKTTATLPGAIKAFVEKFQQRS